MGFTFNPFTGNFDKVESEWSKEKSQSISNNATSQSVTDLNFSTNDRSFKAICSIEVDATTDLFERFELVGVRDGSAWDISEINSLGDDTGITFDITAAGQVQYTSPSFAGYVSATMKFKFIKTSAA